MHHHPGPVADTLERGARMAETTDTAEDWRPVPGYPGYEVSDLGRVRSYRSRQGHPQREPRVLTPVIRFGYQWVKLTRSRPAAIHRLVLEVFVGSCPDGLECRHLDGCRSNNRLGNLAWGTRSENYDDRRGHGTANDGERHGNAKLTNDLVRAIYTSDLDDSDASHHFGVAQGVVAKIRFGQTWQGITGAPRQSPGRRRGERNVRAKLVEAQVLAIRASSELLRVLADRYGVTTTLISLIRRREIWKHLP